MVYVDEIGPATRPNASHRATRALRRTRPRHGQTPENSCVAVGCTGTLGLYPNALVTFRRTVATLRPPAPAPARTARRPQARRPPPAAWVGRALNSPPDLRAPAARLPHYVEPPLPVETPAAPQKCGLWGL